MSVTYEKQMRRVTVAVRAECDGCGSDIPAGPWGDENWDNAMYVRFIGYMGGFIDSGISKHPEALLCSDCCSALVTALPWAGRLLGLVPA